MSLSVVAFIGFVVVGTGVVVVGAAVGRDSVSESDLNSKREPATERLYLHTIYSDYIGPLSLSLSGHYLLAVVVVVGLRFS